MKVLRKALLLITLFAFGQISWAQIITDVVVIGANDDDDADWYYDNYEGAGWIGKVRDLNDGAGGHMQWTALRQQPDGTTFHQAVSWEKVN